MQVIKAPSVAAPRAVELPNGTVYTWGDESYFFMVCSNGKAVCLNTGQMTEHVSTHRDQGVRVVKGAFHAED